MGSTHFRERLVSWLRNPFMQSRWSVRNAAVVAAALILVAWARPSARSWLLALPFVLAGEGLRVWAAGHLHKTRELAISGPYSHVRHPLYLGTLLIGSGFCLMLGGMEAAVALLGWLAVYFLSYLPRKERRETDRLARRHGEVYAAYRSEVPALLPRLSAWKAPGAESEGRWSFARVRENDELGTAFAVALLLFVLTVKVEVCGGQEAGRDRCSIAQIAHLSSKPAAER